MDDIAYYLSDGDLVAYKHILQSFVNRVYRTYYLKKVDIVNGLIVQLDSIIKNEEQSRSFK